MTSEAELAQDTRHNFFNTLGTVEAYSIPGYAVDVFNVDNDAIFDGDRKSDVSVAEGVDHTGMIMSERYNPVDGTTLGDKREMLIGLARVLDQSFEANGDPEHSEISVFNPTKAMRNRQVIRIVNGETAIFLLGARVYNKNRDEAENTVLDFSDPAGELIPRNSYEFGFAVNGDRMRTFHMQLDERATEFKEIGERPYSQASYEDHTAKNPVEALRDIASHVYNAHMW